MPINQPSKNILPNIWIGNKQGSRLLFNMNWCFNQMFEIIYLFDILVDVHLWDAFNRGTGLLNFLIFFKNKIFFGKVIPNIFHYFYPCVDLEQAL